MAVTFEDSLNVMPCLCWMRWNCLPISASMPGKMRSRNSTTVTSLPRRRHTEPSSSPITPAPTTSSLPGTFSSARAPVDDTMRFSSISMPFSRATSEPVAMTIFFVSTVCVLPSAPFTSILPGAVIVPCPMKASILFFLNRNATPLTLPSTPSSLNFCIAARSSFGAETLIPIFSKSPPASSNRCEACSSAFEGMQPTFKHVPPKVLSFSTTATFSPSCAARIAQT